MSGSLTTFEVRVEVDKGQEHYGYYPVRKGSNAFKGVIVQDTIIKMYHYDRRTPKQAIQEAQKHGTVLSCRKADIERIGGNPENTKLEQSPIYGSGSPYQDAISMDEMVWNKRNKRRKNLHKDKNIR